ncbi:MAG: oxygen-independent coproporphyrinogen III oxidase [Burkholderiales bacterium]
MSACPVTLDIDRDLIRRYDMLGPRYTSYPTADRFVEAFDGVAHAAWMEKRGIGGVVRPLSLYAHIPFCASICYYCACNKVVTRDHGRSAKYLRYLEREVELRAALLGAERHVTQLHLGGGTPTFLSHEEMRTLMRMLRGNFDIDRNCEISIEVDPRSIAPDTMQQLADLGFNRVSIGVQDTDPAVQQAINRIQSVEMTMAALSAARSAGFGSINFDLIYGLPRQTLETFSRTLEHVLDAAPDRVALYGYAHLPTRFKPQRRIAEADMPTGETKLNLFLLALERLQAAGYVYIGLDHFAKPGDELAVALRTGRLHRNFQGYTTQPDCDLIAIGISAISRVGPTYSQNVYSLDDYYDCLDQSRLPVVRGIELTADDLARRAVIMALMCQGEVSFESIAIAHLIDFREYFAPELAELAPLLREGLLEIEPGEIRVTRRGRFFLRAICMPFDRYLRVDLARSRYSKII